jgi:hypothetical protein
VDEEVKKCAVLCSQDVRHLASKLKGEVELIRVPFPKFNHIDFMWAKDVYELVYESVINSLAKRIQKKTLKKARNILNT